MPKMRHPRSKHVIEVDSGQVAMYQTQGWQVEPTRLPATKKTSARKTTKAPAATDKE